MTFHGEDCAKKEIVCCHSLLGGLQGDQTFDPMTDVVEGTVF